MMQVIQLVDCDVYSYKSDHDGDPFGEKGAMCVGPAGLHVVHALLVVVKERLLLARLGKRPVHQQFYRDARSACLELASKHHP